MSKNWKEYYFLNILKSYRLDKIMLTLFNVSWIFFDKMFRIATGLIVGVLIARYLGPSQFGVLSYVSVFPLVLTAFAGLGLTNILFNEFVVKDNLLEVKSIISSSIIIKLLSGLICYVLIVIVISFTQKDYIIIKLIFITSTGLIIQCLDVSDVYFQSKRKIKYSIIPKLIVFIVATALRSYGLLYKEGIDFFIVVTTIELLFSSILTIIVFIKYLNFNFSEITFNFDIVKGLLKLSWPLMLSEFLFFLYVRVDVIMIQQLSNSTELGNFSVSMRITDVWYFIPIALTTSLLPSIILLHSSNHKEYLIRYSYLLRVLILISIFSGILVSIYSSKLINFMYGKEYIGAAAILNINMWSGIFVFLAIGSDNWFVLEKLPRFVLYRTIAGACINVILDFMLIPKFGAIGASIATLIAQVFAAYLINGLYKKTKQIFRLQTDALLFLPAYILSFAQKGN